MPKVKISVLSLLLIPLVIFDPSGEIAATIISAAIHEAGHIIVILLCGIGIKELRITPYGLEISTSRTYRSFIEEIAVNSAGCILNFLSFATLFRFGGFYRQLADASLILGILNSLPVISLDGGESLHSLLSILFSYSTAQKISRTISFITLLAMWTIAAYIFLFSGYNYSLFIMTVWLFGKIYCQKN